MGYENKILNPKTDLRFFFFFFFFRGEIQNGFQSMHNRRGYFGSKSKPVFLRFVIEMFSWERIRKKYIWEAVSLWYYSSIE